jgi:hypothetical protein
VALFAINKVDVFRAVAVLLLALCAGFTFPESHYSMDKTFVKAPSPQTEICSLLCDDAEDSNDVSTGIHFLQNTASTQLYFLIPSHTLSKSTRKSSWASSEQVFLLHRQLLI